MYVEKKQTKEINSAPNTAATMYITFPYNHYFSTATTTTTIVPGTLSLSFVHLHVRQKILHCYSMT